MNFPVSHQFASTRNESIISDAHSRPRPRNNILFLFPKQLLIFSLSHTSTRKKDALHSKNTNESSGNLFHQTISRQISFLRKRISKIRNLQELKLYYEHDMSNRKNLEGSLLLNITQYNWHTTVIAQTQTAHAPLTIHVQFSEKILHAQMN